MISEYEQILINLSKTFDAVFKLGGHKDLGNGKGDLSPSAPEGATGDRSPAEHYPLKRDDYKTDKEELIEVDKEVPE
jgi:hypothetical protein